jgi:hypothetical protein
MKEIKIKRKINKIGTNNAIEKTNKTSYFLDNINKIDI